MNKNLAYVIGVYLGDGSVMSDKRTFGLQVIDKDFAEKTVECLKTISKNSVRMREMPRLTSAKKMVYGVYCSDVELCRQLKAMTNNKNNLPGDIETWKNENRLALISGLLDSEGYVAMSDVHTVNEIPVFNMTIGIGAVDTWLYELYHLLQKLGVKVGKLTRERIKSGKIFAKFVFNKKSFVENGLYFNIFRKQQRIENYKKLFPGSTTIRGIPKTDYMKRMVSLFAQRRPRVGGKFIKMGNDIV